MYNTIDKDEKKDLQLELIVELYYKTAFTKFQIFCFPQPCCWFSLSKDQG